eukprot:4857333-Alexandrium_andersonii.AAC.1
MYATRQASCPPNSHELLAYGAPKLRPRIGSRASWNWLSRRPNLAPASVGASIPKGHAPFKWRWSAVTAIAITPQGRKRERHSL